MASAATYLFYIWHVGKVGNFRTIDCLDCLTLKIKALKPFELITSRCGVTSQKTLKLEQQRCKNLKHRLPVISSEVSEMFILRYYLWRCWGTPRVHIRELHCRQHTQDYRGIRQFRLNTTVLYVYKLRSKRCQLLRSCRVCGRLMSMEHWCYDKPKYLVTNLSQ